MVGVRVGLVVGLLVAVVLGGEVEVHGQPSHDGLPPGIQGRIVNGEAVDITEYPFQVSVEKNGMHMCGGAIISKHYILTARHCFRPETMHGAQFTVRVNMTARHHGGTLHQVDKVLSYPEGKSEGDVFDYDITLLHVEPAIKFGRGVESVEPPPPSPAGPAAKTRVQVTGYGVISEKGLQLSKQLMKADLSVWDFKDCHNFFAAKGVTITDRMICAGSNRQDACQGDSGGPLVGPSKKLIGLVSFGLGCGRRGYPGVYTHLGHPAIRNFIEKNAGV